MCGRYFYSPSDLKRELPGQFRKAGEAVDVREEEPRDIHPGDTAPVLCERQDQLSLEDMRWGFEGTRGGLVINARSETIDRKPMFSPLSDKQRCAIPASRYYEWRRSDRQKYCVGLKEDDLFFMAGLYRSGVRGWEFVILTQTPVAAIAAVHSRMPLLLDSPNAVRCWLSGEMPVFQASDALSVEADGPEQLQMSFL